MTALPPNFDMYFEMPSKDRGIVTFNKCYGVTMMEANSGYHENVLKALCYGSARYREQRETLSS